MSFINSIRNILIPFKILSYRHTLPLYFDSDLTIRFYQNIRPIVMLIDRYLIYPILDHIQYLQYNYCSHRLLDILVIMCKQSIPNHYSEFRFNISVPKFKVIFGR